MALKLFEFLLMAGVKTITLVFFDKPTKFEKTGSIGKNFISLGNSMIIKFHFQNYKLITFFVTFTVLLFDNGVCLSFNNGTVLNLNRNQTAIREAKNIHLTKKTSISRAIYDRLFFDKINQIGEKKRLQLENIKTFGQTF